MFIFEGVDFAKITPRQAAARLAAGEEVLFLDARKFEDFELGCWQIKGALRTPADHLARLPALPDDAVAVVYCTCPGEASSALVALKLREQGIEAYALKGGLDAWIREGLPVEPKAVVPELASQI